MAPWRRWEWRGFLGPAVSGARAEPQDRRTVLSPTERTTDDPRRIPLKPSAATTVRSCCGAAASSMRSAGMSSRVDGHRRQCHQGRAAAAGRDMVGGRAGDRRHGQDGDARPHRHARPPHLSRPEHSHRRAGQRGGRRAARRAQPAVLPGVGVHLGARHERRQQGALPARRVERGECDSGAARLHRRSHHHRHGRTRDRASRRPQPRAGVRVGGGRARRLAGRGPQDVQGGRERRSRSRVTSRPRKWRRRSTRRIGSG